MINQNKVIYREIQRPRQLLLWLLALLVTVFMWYGFIQQIIFGIPLGSNPAPDAVLVALWLIFGIAFPIIMLIWMKLIIEVRDDGLYIRFMPFHTRYRQFLYKEITHYEPIIYSGFERFGGWGIRVNFKGETAYTMNGNQGLELKLRNKTVVIGTQKPEELKKAMDALNKSQPPTF
ncbi:DUF6141 family protein [Paenibacillus eucommiae]|uniref:DUF6141 family protein n=1 Tax=Paenibacillus eucommiae TaxID=1355755 RepID=UPI001AEAE5ED|nr:DUF6141 family protein [Paenibacillus eucommiae]